MVKQLPLRQRVRKGLIILAFLSFPITMNFLSPYIIVDGAMNGVVNGSLVMFGLMLLSALLLGRAWCGWVCPGGGMQEMVEPLNRKPVNGKRLGWIKWTIWIPWITLIAWLAVAAGGYTRINLLHLTETGISVDEPVKYITYYLVVFLFLVLAVTVGKRAGCHTVCWMAPFMIIGRWMRNRFAWPSLRLAADASACTNCKTCTSNCPMSLDVNAMVQKEQMEHSECILCMTCVDGCTQNAIRQIFNAGK